MAESANPLPPMKVGFAVRSAIAGVLMGLANLVPGISGGTMLLATGVYPHVIRGVAEVSMFRFRLATLLVLGCVFVGAGTAILGLASVAGYLVVHHRWIMYSLFIGLTLGGVPVLWRMLRRVDATVVVATLAGLGAMAAVALVEPATSAGASGDGEQGYVMVFLAGLAGASAMILPGVSGAYLLLVLGQYVTVLAAIDEFRQAAGARDMAQIMGTMHVLVPLMIGVVIGVAGVSNVIKILLERYERATLAFLLGLLIGAVLGLWPFAEAVEPAIGDVLKGVELTTAEMVAEVARQDWPTRRFVPTVLQVAASVGLAGAGFVISMAVARLGRNSHQPPAGEAINHQPSAISHQ